MQYFPKCLNINTRHGHIPIIRREPNGRLKGPSAAYTRSYAYASTNNKSKIVPNSGPTQYSAQANEFTSILSSRAGIRPLFFRCSIFVHLYPTHTKTIDSRTVITCKLCTSLLFLNLYHKSLQICISY